MQGRGLDAIWAAAAAGHTAVDAAAFAASELAHVAPADVETTQEEMCAPLQSQEMLAAQESAGR